MTARTSEQRKIDAVRRLERDANVWIATAGEGVPHSIPLSLHWDGQRIIVATPTDSPTVANAVATGRARASLDSADDVVIVDADVEAIDLATAGEEVASAYVERVGWDPRSQPGAWSLLLLTPRTVLAWIGVAEIEGRVIMRRGSWTT